MTIEKDNKTALKEAFDTELLKQLEENPPEIPSYEKFSSMIDGEVKKHRRRIHIISTAASIALLFLAGIATFSYFAPDIQADKNPKEEIITEDGVIIEDGGWGSSEEEDNVWSTADWKHISDARVVEPKLLVPEYIPKGFNFKGLIVERFAEVDSTSEYSFYDEDSGKSLEVEVTVQRSNLITINIGNVTKEIQSSKGTIYIQEDGKKATIQIDDGIIVNIWGELPDNEYIKIVERLK